MGDWDAVKSFLDSGLDVNARDRSGRTALMEAVSHGRTGIVNLLLSNGANIEVNSLSGENILRLCGDNQERIP